MMEWWNVLYLVEWETINMKQIGKNIEKWTFQNTNLNNFILCPSTKRYMVRSYICQPCFAIQAYNISNYRCKC